MLMQNFKSAEDLDLPEDQRSALIKTLVLLETNRLIHTPFEFGRLESDSAGPDFTGMFNMGIWAGKFECGTIACIGGTAEIIGQCQFGNGRSIPRALEVLFNPQEVPQTLWTRITTAQAAMALRSYLTTGEANWKGALHAQPSPTGYGPTSKAKP